MDFKDIDSRHKRDQRNVFEVGDGTGEVLKEMLFILRRKTYVSGYETPCFKKLTVIVVIIKIFEQDK